MTLVLPVLALLAALLLVAGGAGAISQEAWIEGCLLAALLLAGCVVFAVVMVRIA